MYGDVTAHRELRLLLDSLERGHSGQLKGLKLVRKRKRHRCIFMRGMGHTGETRSLML
jgi:hypothetical protein